MACDPQQMKQQNIHLLRKVLWNQRVATKPQLAKWSGLSVVTVNSLLQELLQRHEVIVDTRIPSTGGRPALRYRYHAQYQMALVVYMYVRDHVEWIFLEVQDVFQQTVYKKAFPLKEILIEQLEEEITHCIMQYPQLAVIVFGIPGAARYGTLMSMDYTFLPLQELLDRLKQSFPIELLVENDVNAALLGYCSQQKEPKECIAGIFFPQHYPPGCAVCIHGEIIHGANGMVGEIDQLPLDIDWHTFHSKEKQRQRLAKVLRSVVCMYDPHKLVLYCDHMEEDITSIHLSWGNLIPPTLLKRSFHDDFSQGVSQLAKQAIQKRIERESE